MMRDLMLSDCIICIGVCDGLGLWNFESYQVYQLSYLFSRFN